MFANVIIYLFSKYSIVGMNQTPKYKFMSIFIEKLIESS